MTDKLVSIGTFVYSLRAYLTKGRLESEDIDCFLANENFRYGIHLNFEDGLELLVKEEDEAKALTILNEIEQEFGKEATADFDVEIRKILVPVDFSENSINACQYALGLASIFKAGIRLFHSYYIPTLDTTIMGETSVSTETIDEHLKNIRNNAKTNLDLLLSNLQNQLKERGIKEVSVEVNTGAGFADDEIYKEYKDYDPDIIIMGTNGSNDEIKKLHGSVTAKIIEHVKVPVLTVPPGSGFKDITSLKRIVYITNFDESDFRAIHKLLYLISPFKMEVHCLHIASRAKGKWDEIKLEGLKEHFRKAYIGPEIKVDIIRSENLIEAIDDYMLQHDIDVAAMVTHKKNFLTRFFKPGITRKMLFRTQVPLLVFH
jgi:nucleotide-binding universal stress UspA family protein